MQSNSLIGVSCNAWYIGLCLSKYTVLFFWLLSLLFNFINAFFVPFKVCFISFKYSSTETSISTSFSIVSISTTPSWTFIAHILAKQVALNFEKLNLPTFESFC